ncbi:MAG TPA: penicillin-binding transpeptidase domain-containing protein [Solirubrobacteraceae bacterium]|nr:penicillin-binding transpeptidase domain-containing protein [Solirubrobacteraceae bacterium]
MNAPVLRLYGLVIVLFAVLIGFTSRWTVFEAEQLRDNPRNARTILEEQEIRRGAIRSADGRLLARSVRGPGETYVRRYPTGELFAHAVGYAYIDLGRAGLERSRNDELTGRRTELVTAVESILGRSQEGYDVRTTLDAGAQQTAIAALAGRKGAVVALDVHTGAVRVLASTPAYDPNRLQEDFRRLTTDDANAPLLNRATQNGYPPGSTMKVVTAAAALDSGRYEPGSVVDGNNGKIVSGVPLNNFGGQSFGAIDLTTALTNSVNTVWAEVGLEVGRRRMQAYMERFGFYAKPPMDYPEDQMSASGVRKRGRLTPVTRREVDLGRVAIGQGDLFATPLQMAEVAATIANGGRRMKPYLMSRAIDADGRTVEEAEPEVAARVVSRGTAEELTAMMKQVVREGTGTAAALGGVEVAGKTGTAELNLSGLNQPWFIGFTSDVAVAVTLERVQGGTGGTVAAPIAKAVLEALGSRQ